MKTFEVNENTKIVCNCVNTRYGFKHDAKLFINNSEIAKTKCCCYNRTWESFEYESVISDLLNKTEIMTSGQKSEFLNLCRKNKLDEINKQFGCIANIAKPGNILTNNQVEANDWKKRMLNAGLSDKGLMMPEDWDQLTEDEKTKRLDNVIEFMTNKVV
jgi:hypothetical protein